jgi:hypothetical protein
VLAVVIPFQRNQDSAMTVTEICLLAWAILGIIVVAMLRFPERKG